MQRPTHRPWHLAALAVLASVSALAQPKPIGFGLQVSTDGLFSSTVAKAVVTQVVPDSQAHAAGLSVGDELVKVQGLVVPGNSAATLKPHMEFVPGEPKRLVFKRPNGTEYEVTLTRAAAK